MMRTFSIIHSFFSAFSNTRRLSSIATLFLISVFCLLISARSANAACSNPAGIEKDLVYNYSYRVYQYCNGTIWVQAGPQIYNPTGANFESGFAYMNASNIGTDGKTVSGSFWFRREEEFGRQQTIFRTNPAGQNVYRFVIRFTTNNRLQFAGRNSAGTDILNAAAATQIMDTKWHHVAFAIDLAQSDGDCDPAILIYIDGVREAFSGAPLCTDDIVNFFTNNNRLAIGSDTGSTGEHWEGALADVWMTWSSYIDFTQSANLEKFISADGWPVYLGKNGEIPLGGAPALFLSGDLASWHTNKGFRGGWTLSNTINTTYSRLVGAGLDLPLSILNWWNLGSYLQFDESSGTTADDSVGSLDGTLTNGPVWQPAGGKVGGALDFDGIDDRVELPASGIFDYDDTTSWTWMAWVKFSACQASGSHILSISNATFNSTANLLCLSDGRPRFSLKLSWVTNNVTAATAVDDDAWHHVAAVKNEELMMIFVDGIPEGTIFTPGFVGNPISSRPLWIGDSEEGGARKADGLIDDVRIYYQPLSEAEIAAIAGVTACANPDGAQGSLTYNTSRNVMQYCDGRYWRPMGKDPGTGGAGCANPSGIKGDLTYNTSEKAMQYCDGAVWRTMGGGVPTATTSGLVGWWKMDESSGNAADSSGNSNTGTLVGNAAYATGKINNGITLDNSGDWISIANESNFDFERTDSFTISAWFNRTANSDTDDIFGKQVAGGAYAGYDLILSPSTDCAIGCAEMALLNNYGGNNYLLVRTANGTVSNGVWTHIVMTYGGTSSPAGIHIYINGTDMALTTVNNTLTASILTNDSPLIGTDNSTGWAAFNGMLDDVRVYNRVLSAGEVLQLYYATGGQ